MLFKHIFLKTEFRSLALLTSLQLMNGNRRQNGQKVFKGYSGIAIGQRIVSIGFSPAFQRETNVLTDNVYLASSEISVRIPLLYSWLFI